MNAFTLMPMNQSIELEPGEVYTGSVKVAVPAEATEDFHFAVSVSPYGVLGEDYTADLATRSNRSQILDWIKIENPTGVVRPNETAEVKFTITVPETAPAGGQYAAIGVRSATAEAAGEGVQVQNIFEMVSLIYANVAGETVRDGGVVSNVIPGFVTNGAPATTALLVNNGNVHELATTTIRVKNAITGEVILPKTDVSNVYADTIMPESSRYLMREISNMPMLGVFEVSQDISYLGKTSTNTTTMIMCPIWFLVMVVITMGAIIGGVAAKIVKRRRLKAI